MLFDMHCSGNCMKLNLSLTVLAITPILKRLTYIIISFLIVSELEQFEGGGK